MGRFSAELTCASDFNEAILISTRWQFGSEKSKSVKVLALSYGGEKSWLAGSSWRSEDCMHAAFLWWMISVSLWVTPIQIIWWAEAVLPKYSDDHSDSHPGDWDGREVCLNSKMMMMPPKLLFFACPCFPNIYRWASNRSALTRHLELLCVSTSIS